MRSKVLIRGLGGTPEKKEPELNERIAELRLLREVDRAVAVAEFPFYISIGVVTNHAELVSWALVLVEPDSLQAGNLLSTYDLSIAELDENLSIGGIGRSRRAPQMS